MPPSVFLLKIGENGSNGKCLVQGHDQEEVLGLSKIIFGEVPMEAVLVHGDFSGAGRMNLVSEAVRQVKSGELTIPGLDAEDLRDTDPIEDLEWLGSGTALILLNLAKLMENRAAH